MKISKHKTENNINKLKMTIILYSENLLLTEKISFLLLKNKGFNFLIFQTTFNIYYIS